MNKSSLILAAIGIALLVGAASAGNQATVTGNVVNTATVTVSETSVDFGDFLVLGDNLKEVPNFINVTTNYNVKLQAYESDNGDGKMSVTDGGTTYTLYCPLEVGIADYDPVEISGDPKDVSSTMGAGAGDYAGKFVQKVVPTDHVANGYSITVTFAATAA